MAFIYCTPTFLLCLDYVSIGPRFSNIVLQALLVLLRKQPPAVSHSLPPSLPLLSLPPSLFTASQITDFGYYEFA